MLLLLAAAGVVVFSVACLAAETVKLHKALGDSDARCLRELLRQSSVNDLSSSEIDSFIVETVFGRADLKGRGRRQSIFLIHNIGYCGSAGCLMLIGERQRDGRCHLLDEGSGAYAGDYVIVMRRRDHGYRRLLTPCEIYFDGRWYQQVHEECPTIDVQR